MSHTYTYEDEVLPEIEIRELMSLEEVLEANPSFVAFTREEIMSHLHDLLRDDAGAVAPLTDTIYEVAQGGRREADDLNMVPILKADKRQIEEVEEEDYVQALEDMKRAPNYQAQQALLRQLTYPLTHVPPTGDEEGFVASRRTHVGTSGGVAVMSVMLPSDPEAQAIAGFAYSVPVVTDESYLVERATATQAPPNLLMNTRRPSFDTVLASITQLPDLHGLRHALLRYGYHFDSLSNAQLADLVRHLRDLDEPSDADVVTGDKKKRARNFPRELNWRDFYEALADVRIPSVDAEKYNAIYNSLATALTSQVSAAAAQQAPIDNAGILEGLVNNAFSLDDLVGFLRTTRNRIILDNAFATIQRYMELDTEAIPDTLQALVERWSRRAVKYDDRTAAVFLDMYRDMAEIKQGTDTSLYDGNPSEMSEQVFEETVAFDDIVSDVLVDDDDVPVAAEDDKLDATLFAALSDGVRDVMIPVVLKMTKLSKAAGIPLAREALRDMIAMAAPHVVRLSFAETVQQTLPDVAQSVRSQLASGMYDSAMRVAMGIVPVSIGERAQAVVKQMYREYAHTLRATFLMTFTWYVLQVQAAFLENRLDFDVAKGALSCIHLYAPLGAPITKDKEQVGVIWYMSCVAEECGLLDEFRWSSYEDLGKAALSYIAEHMSATVEELHSKHSNFIQTQQDTTSKARQANVSLAEAIEAKSKKRILPSYIQAFLNIPGSLASANTKHPRFAVGCCMQQLGQEFVADSDWQGMKKLKAVKDQLAKKRMTKAPRPGMALFPPKTVHTKGKQEDTEEEMYVPVPTDEVATSTFVQWLATCKQEVMYLLPANVVEALATDPTSVSAMVTKHVSSLLKTINKKSAPFEKYFSSNSDDMSRYLDIVAASLMRSRARFMPDLDPEYGLLDVAIAHITEFKRRFAALGVVCDPVDSARVQYMIRYVVTRAACLPCDPLDANHRTGRLALGDRVSADFVQQTLSTTFQAMQASITSSDMPTAEDQQAFITKMREIQKIQTLNALNSQTDEDRLMMIEAKKLGLYKNKIDYESAAGGDAEEAEGEREFQYAGEDPDVGDEYL